MICPNCGANNPDNSAFCRECGTRLGAAQSDAAACNTGIQRASTTAPQMVTPAATPQPSWPATQSPTAAYSNLGSNYQTAPAMAPEPPAQQKKKGGAGKVIIAIVIIALLAAAGYFAWQNNLIPFLPAPTSQTESKPASEPEATTPETTTPEATTPEEPAASESTSDNPLIGVWTGMLTKTDPHYAGQKSCKGGLDKPIVLTIRSVDEHGRMVADLKVCYHNHDYYNGADVASDPGDVYVEFTDIQLINQNNSFEYVADVNEYYKGGSLNIDFTYDENEDTIYAVVDGITNTRETNISEQVDSYSLFKD